MNKIKFAICLVLSCVLWCACGAGAEMVPGAGGAGDAGDAGADEVCDLEVDAPRDQNACMRYHIQLMGSPATDAALWAKYEAAFGKACYVSEGGGYGCYYRSAPRACDDAVRVPDVYGAAPYDKQYPCVKVSGTDNYERQYGADPAEKTIIDYLAAPRQDPRVDMDGTPGEFAGPYSGLPDTTGAGGLIGGLFTTEQKTAIYEANKKANAGKIRSDLAGFTWPCEVNGQPTTCTEPDMLDFASDLGAQPQVHHVVPRKDKRCCPWGTNSLGNAAVISAKLNNFLSNESPPKEEIKMLMSAQKYVP